MNDMKEVVKQLALNAERVVQYLYGNIPKRSGNNLVIGSIDGEKGKSLSICISGSKAGKFYDFASSEHRGDLLELWKQKENITILEAFNRAKNFLGISDTNKSIFYNFTPIKKISKGIVPAIEPTLKENSLSAVKKYLIEERKLSNEILKLFKISETDSNEIVFNSYIGNEIHMKKILNLNRTQDGKKIIKTDLIGESCLFGWQSINDDDRIVAITEGEIDAMSLRQYGLPALSVPNGAQSLNWLEYEYENLKRFEDIYICFDNDKVGKKGANALFERLGVSRAKIVTLPLKDANECLMKDILKQQIMDSLIDAANKDPEELRDSSQFLDEVIKSFHPDDDTFLGYNSQWTENDMMFRPGEVTLWGGINGHGKSQFVGQLMLELMKQDAKICIASLELKPVLLLKRMTRQATALHEPSEEYIKKVFDWFEGRLKIFDVIGYVKIASILETFRYAKHRYGVNVFVIDSLSLLEISDDDYEGEKRFMTELMRFVKDYNCHVHMVVHPRKLKDESQPPGKMDIKGSGSITNFVDNVMVVWRNKNKERARYILENDLFELDEKEQLDKIMKKSDVMLYCYKQRHGDGWEGKIGVNFDTKSCQYLKKGNKNPVRYVDYNQ